MRVEPLNMRPATYVTFPANVRPIRNVTQAPRSGLRPQDLNDLLKSMVNSKNAMAMKLISVAYDQRGKIKSTLVNTLPELFVGNKMDVRA